MSREPGTTLQESRRTTPRKMLRAVATVSACLGIAVLGVPLVAGADGSGLGQPGGDEDIKEISPNSSKITANDKSRAS